ncbi:hypothetical protein IC582_025401 [Cucumis melo]
MLCLSAIVQKFVAHFLCLQQVRTEDLLRSSAAQGKLCSSAVVQKFIMHRFSLQQNTLGINQNI